MSVHAEPPPPIVSEPHGVNYATANQLGKGGFAICFKAERLDKDRPTGHLVALKIVKTKMEPAKLAQKFVTELQIHSKLTHPNIVAFHRAFSFGANTYVVLELCSSGSLADLLKRRKNITMPEIRRFIIQVSGAVKYLHARNIVHRDLKTGNLFLDEHMNIKVGDFGLAALLVSGKDMDAKRRTTMCGTPNYLAPEILEKGKGHNEKVDLWAIGIIAYTLAVGKAPFHASSKDEIYKKLRAGDYSWPELSSITNEISADLRDLVSSLLVAEELRPNPDQIVAHPFFKIAFVPRQMGRLQLTKAPIWPNVSLPSPEVLQRGYSDSWWHVCKESGVGEYAPGRCFQLSSGKRIRSVVREIEREVAAGRQPVLPIPEDTVYTTFPHSSSWASQTAAALDGIAEEQETATDSRRLKEISNNEVQMNTAATFRASLVESDAKKQKDAEMMPPPPRVRRQDTVRRTRTVSQESVRAKAAEAEPSKHTSQSHTSQSPVENDANIASMEPSTKRADGASLTKRSVDASLARRPRTIRKDIAGTEARSSQPVSNLVEKVPSRTTLAMRPVKAQPKQVMAEVIEIYDDDDAKPERCVVLPRPPVMQAKLPVPRRTKTISDSVIAGTDPDTVLARLCAFRDSLAATIERRHVAPSRRAATQVQKPLPFVSRWVDYSRKHGVGYVLEDGTVGFIANASPSRGMPVTHVAVRNGERWLRRVGKKFENLENVPFQILEDCGEAGIRKAAVEASNDRGMERVRMLKVLWVKFGRYMTSIASSSDETDDCGEVEGDGKEFMFVRFYQRLGNVGIWGFSDGCIQVHFPDHTKFVFSADGSQVSATLVPVEGVEAIERQNDLPMKLLRERETIAHSIHGLLYGCQAGRGQKAFAGIVSANMVQQKLEFLVTVLEQWIEGGGLGRARSANEKLQWQGPWVNEHARKIDWVTVGRTGGDEAKE